jgi:hypothetical protein
VQILDPEDVTPNLVGPLVEAFGVLERNTTRAAASSARTEVVVVAQLDLFHIYGECGTCYSSIKCRAGAAWTVPCGLTSAARDSGRSNLAMDAAGQGWEQLAAGSIGRWPEDAPARGDGSGRWSWNGLGEEQPLHHHPPTNGRFGHTGDKGIHGERNGGGRQGQDGRLRGHEDIGRSSARCHHGVRRPRRYMPWGGVEGGR